MEEQINLFTPVKQIHAYMLNFHIHRGSLRIEVMYMLLDQV